MSDLMTRVVILEYGNDGGRYGMVPLRVVKLVQISFADTFRPFEQDTTYNGLPICIIRLAPTNMASKISCRNSLFVRTSACNGFNVVVASYHNGCRIMTYGLCPSTMKKVCRHVD